MKISILTCLCSAAAALTLFAQEPVTTPGDAVAADPNAPVEAASAAPSPAAASVPAAASPGVTAAPRTPDDLESKIERKAKRGVNITFGDGDPESKRRHDQIDLDNPDISDGALMAIPIVGIIFTTLFGAPVLVVGLIMFFSYWKARSLHRTVRLMVEKGQPVPEALFATPHSPARARSDMRRGVVLMMVGIGLVVFFGAVNDWDGGAWAIGIIPFLIGAGYLLVWKLEGPKPSADNSPRVS